MGEYGAPFDLRELPRPMFRAHLAILSGRADRRAEEAEEIEADADDAQREVNRGHRQ